MCIVALYFFCYESTIGLQGNGSVIFILLYDIKFVTEPSSLEVDGVLHVSLHEESTRL